jgi:hypothetical protein
MGGFVFFSTGEKDYQSFSDEKPPLRFFATACQESSKDEVRIKKDETGTIQNGRIAA